MLNFDEVKELFPVLEGKEVKDGDMIYYYPEMSEIRNKIFPILKEHGIFVKQTQSSRVDNGVTIVNIATYIGRDEEFFVNTANEVVVYKDSKLSGLQAFGATLTYVSRVAMVFALGLQVQERSNKPTLKSFGNEFKECVKAVNDGASREDIETKYVVSDEVWSKIFVSVSSIIIK